MYEYITKTVVYRVYKVYMLIGEGREGEENEWTGK